MVSTSKHRKSALLSANTGTSHYFNLSLWRWDKAFDETRRNYTGQFDACYVSAVTEIGVAQCSALIHCQVIYLAFMLIKNRFHSKPVAAALCSLWLKGFIYTAQRKDCSKRLLLGLQTQVLKNYIKITLILAFWRSQIISMEGLVLTEYSGLLRGYWWTASVQSWAWTHVSATRPAPFPGNKMGRKCCWKH